MDVCVGSVAEISKPAQQSWSLGVGVSIDSSMGSCHRTTWQAKRGEPSLDLRCIQHVRDDRFSFAYCLLSATCPRVESRRKQKKQKEATMILSGKQDLALYYKSVLSQG